jgi:soluble lytic murein transglycosylase
LLRARELFFLNRTLEARREWFQGIRKLNQEEIKQAASMASSWKWHDNAIKTVAKTGFHKDYDLRFPMPYRELVMGQVEKHELDPSVIYGLIRRESLFDPLAKSKVGALGLMQLMPYTARRVAKQLGLKRPAQGDILEVDNNIRLGTQYFKTVLDQFDDNVPLAAAAYNAGPKNVQKWLPQEQPLSADLWVETVPFKETRNYIQAVLAYATIFDKHLGQEVQISSRMQDIRSDY